MVDENTNICDECGYEGPEDTCPQCGGDTTPLEDADEEEVEEEEGEEEEQEQDEVEDEDSVDEEDDL